MMEALRRPAPEVKMISECKNGSDPISRACSVCKGVAYVKYEGKAICSPYCCRTWRDVKDDNANLIQKCARRFKVRLDESRRSLEDKQKKAALIIQKHFRTTKANDDILFSGSMTGLETKPAACTESAGNVITSIATRDFGILFSGGMTGLETKSAACAENAGNAITSIATRDFGTLFFGGKTGFKTSPSACSESAGHVSKSMATCDFGSLFSDSMPGLEAKATADDVVEKATGRVPSWVCILKSQDERAERIYEKCHKTSWPRKLASRRASPAGGGELYLASRS
jgi:hypothetical protein